MNPRRLIVRIAFVLLVGCGLHATAGSAPTRDDRLEALTQGWETGTAPDAFTEQRWMNPEYDFMARTFTVLALTDRALERPETADEAILVMDAILEDTLRQDDPRHWLLPYADARPWRGTGRSLFVDGELLVMLGARRMVRDDHARWRVEMQHRAASVVENLGSAGGFPIAESYPDEGWTFCHAMALLGLRLHETLDGADHSASTSAFLGFAREHLIDAQTGLLGSDFAMDGVVHDGPEGSSLWLTITILQVIDPAFGADQYGRARAALGRSLLGMGYAREWPEGMGGTIDVDSGPIIPLLDASPSSSGLAIAASAAAGDERWHARLVRALGAAEVLLALNAGLAASADNPVGNSVIAWGLGFGPLWERLHQTSRTAGRVAAHGSESNAP